jgi:transcriptional regulator with XRE-family HTH domain
MTQAEVAERAGTSQSAVSVYESGATVPSLTTLGRLLDACGHTLVLDARPTVRRGASSLAELAPFLAGDLARGDEQAARRVLFGFTDDFRGSSRAGQVALISPEPPPTGDARFEAALAGMAEFFASEALVHVPDWVNGPTRFVEPWWFVASRPAFHAYTLAHTPVAFARHGVFIAREVFERV